MFADLIGWLLALVASLAPVPVVDEPVAPPAAVVVVEHSPASQGDNAGTVRAPDARRGTDAPRPSPQPAPVVDEREPGAQLPEEVIGRAVDCPDGSVGYVVDAGGTVDCSA
jgi:hypothetical protein